MRYRERLPSARGMTVKDDWRAWLPEEKDLVFRSHVRQLEISYNEVVSQGVPDRFVELIRRLEGGGGVTDAPDDNKGS